MAVRSARLFGPTALNSTWLTVYTVPSGRTAIIRTLTLANTDTATQGTLVIGVNGTDHDDRLFTIVMPAGTTQRIDSFLVLNPGDTLRAIRQTSTEMCLAGFGALLLGAPA